MMRKRFALEAFRVGSSDLCLASLISSCSEQRRLMSVGGGRGSSTLLLAPQVAIAGVHEGVKESSTIANTSTTEKRNGGGKGRGKNPHANNTRVPVPDFLKRRGFDHLQSKQPSTPATGGNNNSPPSHEDEQAQRAKKLREFVLGSARANANRKNSASGGGGVGGSTVTQRIIETNEVVFTSEDPLQEVLKQVSRNREETVQTQKEMRKLVLSGCANMIKKLRVEHVLSHEQVASESTSFTRGQRRNGTRHQKKSDVGRRKVGKMELKRHIFDSYVLQELATSPRIPSMRAQQAEREHVLREQLLPIAASLAQKAFLSAKARQHEMQSRTEEEEEDIMAGNNGGEEEEEEVVINNSAGRSGDGVEEWTDGEELDFMRSLDDGPPEGDSRINSAPHTTSPASSSHVGGASASASPWAKIRGSTASSTAHAEAEEKTFLPPPEMEIPSFEQLGMLLRAVAECGLGGEDSVVGPLMRCLKLRLELREEARERAREAMTAAEMEEEEAKKASQHQRTPDNSAFATAKSSGGPSSTAPQNPSIGEKDTTTTASLSPVTYELNEDGLWDLMCDDDAASVNNNKRSEANTSENLGVAKSQQKSEPTTTRSSTTYSSSTAKTNATTEMNDKKHHDTAGKPEKQEQQDDTLSSSSSSTAPLHPRVVAELLSSCASLGAMEEAMLIAILETDVEPFYRRNFGAASLVLTMEALGRFGYHKDKEALFTIMGKSLAVQLRPLVVPKHLEANVIELGKRLAKLKSEHKHSRLANTAKERAQGRVEGKEDVSSSPAKESGSSAPKSGRSNGNVGQSKTSERRTQRAILKLQNQYNSALKAFHEARRQRARTYLSIPTRFALSLLRYIAESPIRHPAIIHRLVDVILLKSRHQTAMLVTACRGGSGVSGGGDEGARGALVTENSNGNRDKNKNNTSGTANNAIFRQRKARSKRSVLDHPLVARHRKAICHDALESAMECNGFDTARGLTAEARVNHLLDREEEEAMQRGSNGSSSRFGYSEDDEYDDGAVRTANNRRKGNTHFNSTSAPPLPPLINTLTPEQLQDLSQLMNLMGAPYPKIDKEFMTYIMEREHGALLRRHDRDDDFRPSRHGDDGSDNPQNADGTMDWVRAEAVFGGSLTK